MKIGFYHVDRQDEESDLGYQCARLMVKSAKKFMPSVPVVHFTDTTSKSVKGVDATKRKPAEPMALLRMRHHAGCDGRWLFVDTDVIFQQPVLAVFAAYEFQIAVTTRNWPHVKAAEGFSGRMPFNMGVVFSRNAHFWAECYTRLRDLDADDQEWMGDQVVFNEVIEEGRYLIRRISGATYNFPPEIPGKETKYADLLSQASILHYKGPERKRLLLQPESRRCA
jgi:hypothetical protein